jgi:hypothetical protein
MKPSAKITVPDVIEQFYSFYKNNNCSWGVFNLVLLKANYNNDSVNYCLEQAKESEELQLGKILLLLTQTQRMKISRLCIEKESKEEGVKS